MMDNQPMDALARAEAALRSILSPDENRAAEDVTASQVDEFRNAPPIAARNKTVVVGGEQIDLRVSLGNAYLSPNEVATLRSGAVISLDRLAGDPVDLYAGQRLVARGEAVTVGDRFAVRIVELMGPKNNRASR
jgi:flagellar motor switch protein FliN